MTRTLPVETATRLLWPVFLYFFLWGPGARAQTDENNCYPASEIVYSPFKTWFDWYPNGTRQMCWTAASCVFIQADESRKQQFAATALVMGIIPLTLKDIAWPERRIVHVSKELNWLIDILVRTLGLEPIIPDMKEESATKKVDKESSFIKWARKLEPITAWSMVAVSALFLAGTYAALALVEIYSKRAALGCPYPVFVLTWVVGAIAPAAIHYALSKLRTRNNDPSAYGSKTSTPSAVQGADEWWPVQLLWAIYYAAGTLIYTSIMAVTVIELFVWVVISFSVVGASKMLAFFLCMAFEDGEYQLARS